MRRLQPVLLGVTILISGIAEGRAESLFCERLKQQYMALDMQTFRDNFQLDRARAAFENVRNQARTAGCIGGFLIFKPKPSKQCPAIMARLRAVQRDYARLGGNTGIFGFGRSDTEMQRERLRSTLFTYGCGIPQSGGFRTVCVRACDGYYFPISFSTGRGRFETDQAYCRTVYGGSEADLYIYRNPGEEAEEMVSVDGQRYAAQPFAFAYRSAYDPACAAELTAGLAALAKVAKTGRKAVDPLLPPPRIRPGRGEDPETLANAEGGLSLDRSEAEHGLEVADAGARTIRTVGPAYYYATPIRLDTLGKRPPKPASFGLIGSAEAEERPPETPEP